MTPDRTIPVVETIPEGWQERAQASDFEARMAERDAFIAERCSTLAATGRHDFSRLEGPTFMSGEAGCDAFYTRHCSGMSRLSARVEVGCSVFRIDGERRGSRGRKNIR